jgi:hypothetical protein
VVQVHEFVFYVFCEMLPSGHEMFGYFSREKRSDSNHLACILTMPHKQRKGYGGLIIDYSYKLARKENKPGTPERPLSDLGWVCIRATLVSAVSRAMCLPDAVPGCYSTSRHGATPGILQQLRSI